MKEKFYYLAEKYTNIIFVENKDYKIKNTHSSLYAARNYLKNTYILCSDNYYPDGVFKTYEDRPFTTTQYIDDIAEGERGVITDDTGLIIDTQRPADHKWCMLGYQFFDKKFSDNFKIILENMYNTPNSNDMYWERVYADNVKKLILYEKRIEDNKILEFDTVKELESFDPNYLEEGNYQFINNICNVLKCRPKDISNFELINKGLTNNSFSFMVNDKKYMYRFPGADAPVELDRKLEKKNQELAKAAGIDDSYIYEDENEGWKISNFIEVDEAFDFLNTKHIKLLCNALRKFNSKHNKSGKTFDYIYKTDIILNIIKGLDKEKWNALYKYHDDIIKIEKRLKKDNWDFQLSHNDIWEDNILLSKNKIYLIDWEYAGDADIGYDISKLCVKSKCSLDNLSNYLVNYFDRIPSESEIDHLIGCTAVSYYYWVVWASYMVLMGHDYNNYLERYTNVLNMYYNNYIDKYKEDL